MNKIAFGKQIIKYREKAGLSQEKLAEKMNVSANFISYIERGMKMPSLENYVKLVNALDISSDILLTDEIKSAYKVKASLFGEKIELLPAEDKKRIFTIIDAILDENKL